MKKQILLFAVLSILFISCHNNDCLDFEIETTSLESLYGCTNTKFEMEIDLDNAYVIITNQSDFEALVTGSCQPEIDFSTYDLVIGKKELSNGNNSIAYKLIEDCETGNQILSVTFNQNDTTVAPNLTYHALIPKLANTQKLSVEIIIN